MSGAKVPRFPPALGPWTTRLSAPAATATPASYADVTVTITNSPSAPNRRITSGDGTPKVKDTNSGRRSATTSSLRAQSSSWP